MEISLRSPNLAAGTPLAPSPPTRWGLTCTPLCLPHNLPPLPIQKGKLKLTFHLPHTDFWQALPALRLPALQRAPPPSSEQPKPNRGTWGTRGTGGWGDGGMWGHGNMAAVGTWGHGPSSCLLVSPRPLCPHIPHPHIPHPHVPNVPTMSPCPHLSLQSSLSPQSPMVHSVFSEL